MKYIAVFDDAFLEGFRRDDGGLTLVLDGENKCCTRAVRLKPLERPVCVWEDGESVYLTDGHIRAMHEYEHDEAVKQAMKQMRQQLSDWGVWGVL